VGASKIRDYVEKTRSTVLLSLGHMTNHWYVGVLMVVIPYLRKDFSLTFTEVGLLMSLRSLAGALGNATSGIIADFGGRRTFMLVFSVAGVGFCWFFVGFAQAYVLLLILFPLATLSSNLWHAPAMSILSEAYPERKGFTLGIHGAAANLGQSISPVVVGLLITYLGWRTAVKVNTSPAILTAILLAVMLPGLGILEVKKKTRGEFIQLLKNQILKNKTLFLISLISASRTMGQRGIETFWPCF
jgi:FSR family fosmidomycin resistance protein-like MFS transporter